MKRWQLFVITVARSAIWRKIVIKKRDASSGEGRSEQYGECLKSNQYGKTLILSSGKGVRQDRGETLIVPQAMATEIPANIRDTTKAASIESVTPQGTNPLAFTTHTFSLEAVNDIEMIRIGGDLNDQLMETNGLVQVIVEQSPHEYTRESRTEVPDEEKQLFIKKKEISRIVGSVPSQEVGINNSLVNIPIQEAENRKAL